MRTNREVAMAFANHSHASAGHFFSYGIDCYSYSTKIAEHTHGVTLLNSRNYSATTIKHKSLIRRYSGVLFEVPFIDFLTVEKHAKNVKYMETIAEEYEGKAKRARKPMNATFYRERAKRMRVHIADYKTIFSL